MTTSRQPGFGERLRRMREGRYLTQEKLAEQLGVSVTSINRWEREKSYPRAEQRRGLCAALSVSSEELFGGPHAPVVPGTLGPAGRSHAEAEGPAARDISPALPPPAAAHASVDGRLDDSPFWHVRPVHSLELGDPLLKQGGRPADEYFQRAAFREVRTAVRSAVQRGYGGAVLFGPPMVGKTRMALEALRYEAPDLLLIPWPRHEITLAALDVLAGRPLALLLDDLHELADYHAAGRIVAAVRRLLAIAERVVVVATSRSGADEAATRRHYDGLFESLGLAIVNLTPMEPDDIEASEFLAFVHALSDREPDRRLHFDAFDGTPGSVLLGLDRRTTQLRSLSFPTAAKAILKALALLRAASVYDYPESRVRRVAEEVFELAADQWSDALDYLVGGGWVSLDEGDQRGESNFYVPSDAYLDVCLRESGVYPRSKRRVTSDFPKVGEALSRAPADSAALFALSRAIFYGRGDISSKWSELAVECALRGLAALDPEREPVLWARGQHTLGLSYWKRWQGDVTDNMRRAVAALQAAETVLARGAHPSDWAAVQHALGLVYIDGVLEPKDDLLDRGMEHLHSALEVFTREAFLYDWGRTHNALGVAYMARTRGERDANLGHAIEHLTLAAQVLTRDAHPGSWALVMRNLGEAYAQWSEGDASENERIGIAYCQRVLDAGIRETYPFDWARTHCVLGVIFHHRRSGEPAHNLRIAIAHYAAALEVLTPADHGRDREMALAALEQARARLAEMVADSTTT